MMKKINKAEQKKALDKWERITSALDFDEAAFEREHFLPIGEAMEHGLVEFSDGKGNRHKVQPPVRVTLNLSPVIKKRAESLDASMGMGYQNVLKAAMLIGIKELESKAAVSR